jgi:hypothetical protein
LFLLPAVLGATLDGFGVGNGDDFLVDDRVLTFDGTSWLHL